MKTLRRIVGVVAVACACVGAFGHTGLAVLPAVARWLPEDAEAAKVPGYADTAVGRARAMVRAGQYWRALWELRGVEGEVGGEARGLRAEAYLARGEYEAAEKEATRWPWDVGVVLRVGEARGGWVATEILAREVVTRDPESMPARYGLGRALEMKGDVEGAVAAYGWFMGAGADAGGRNRFAEWTAKQEAAFERPEDVIALGRAADRWATLTGAYRGEAGKGGGGLHESILNLFVRVYDVMDRGNVEAHFAAAEFLAARDQDEQAMEELQAVLAINPRHAGALELLGRMSVDRFDFERAEACVARMRATDPVSARSYVLEGRSLLRQRRPERAATMLRMASERWPRGTPETHGLRAAVAALRLDEKTAQEFIDRAGTGASTSAAAMFELAEVLSDYRQYERSAMWYRKAIERMPNWVAPRNGLGLLLMQAGEEAQGREVLEAARALDPFNLRTTNYLTLLDRVQSFRSVGEGRFVVRYDPSADPVIGEMMLEFMEAVGGEVEGMFDHVPSVSTIVEVYPTHAQFSVRTTGTPWIGTVGASTGRIIALVSPRAGGKTMGSYNWAQVLRHEYAHTVTLSATGNRIPHWMTEGLAVVSERAPLRWEWVPMLYAAVTKDELFDISGRNGITWGFVRPRRPIDRQLAYAQSAWMCEYLVETYGREAMLRMLAEFKAGGSELDAFGRVLRMTPEHFHSDFVLWARQKVKGWGYDAETSDKVEALVEKGQGQIEAKQLAEAAATWERVARLRPVDALPHQRLAGLYLRLGERGKAREQLIALHAVELKDNRLAKRIARLSMEMEDLQAAVKYAREATWIDPYDLGAHELLQEAAETAGEARTVETQRRRIEAIRGMGSPKRPGGAR